MRCEQLESKLLEIAENRSEKLRGEGSDFAKELDVQEPRLLKTALNDALSETYRLRTELDLCKRELLGANEENAQMRQQLDQIQTQDQSSYERTPAKVSNL